jgi:hypothetical protein
MLLLPLGHRYRRDCCTGIHDRTDRNDQHHGYRLDGFQKELSEESR